MKWRNSKERELLASGGSRDQTLPNKNNPNPDLSDARTDRPPSLSPASPSPTSSIVEHTTQSSDTDQMTSKFDNGKDGKLFKTEKSSNDSGQSFAEHIISNSSQILLSHIGATNNEDNRSGHQQQQQLFFNNFYDKVRDINNSSAFNNRGEHPISNSSSGVPNNLSNYYYDELDSNSDEEISVT